MEDPLRALVAQWTEAANVARDPNVAWVWRRCADALLAALPAQEEPARCGCRMEPWHHKATCSNHGPRPGWRPSQDAETEEGRRE